jgi:integrase/recombinase XerD
MSREDGWLRVIRSELTNFFITFSSVVFIIQRSRRTIELTCFYGAQRSIDSYASSVLRLHRFYNKPLEDISEEQLRQYWLCCQSEFGWSAATLRISYSGIQHCFRKTLVRELEYFQ